MTHLILVDVNRSMVEAWRKAFIPKEKYGLVEVKEDSIFNVACDAMVSPANSYGFMDGGLDLQISRFFGWGLQEKLQEVIRTKHRGELLVGLAQIVETDHPSIPFLISAPTMRVPMPLRDTVNVYLAARATFIAVQEFNEKTTANKIERVAMPGLGTGIGLVPFDVAASQVRQAYEEVLLGEHAFPRSWREAQARHIRLYTNRKGDEQFTD